MIRFVYKCLLVAVLLFAARSATPAAAQEKSVEMPGRTAELSIRPDGNVDVCESWTVQFNGGPFTYAWRTFPLDRIDEIAGWRISEDGQTYSQKVSQEPHTFMLSNEEGGRRITWYFPPTSDQQRQFELCYTLLGAVWQGQKLDDFNWQVIETEHDYPIGPVQATVHLPGSFAIDEIKLVKDNYQTEMSIVDGQTVVFKDRDIAPGQGWPILVRFPHGSIDAPLASWQTALDNRPGRSPVAQALTGLVLALGYAVVIGVIWVERSDRRKVVANPSVAASEPDKDGLAGSVKTVLRILGGGILILMLPIGGFAALLVHLAGPDGIFTYLTAGLAILAVGSVVIGAISRPAGEGDGGGLGGGMGGSDFGGGGGGDSGFG